mgnify:CR=1 FL=1
MRGASGCWERGGTSSEGAAVAGLPFFVDLPVSAFVSLFFLLFFPFGLGCAAAPASSMYLVLDPELKSQQKNA